MRNLLVLTAALALTSFAATRSEAAPLGAAAGTPALNTTAEDTGVQQISHRGNHHCAWRRTYRGSQRVCWWSGRSYGPSIYFRFGPDRRYDRPYRRHWRDRG